MHIDPNFKLTEAQKAQCAKFTSESREFVRKPFWTADVCFLVVCVLINIHLVFLGVVTSWEVTKLERRLDRLENDFYGEAGK